MIWKPVILSNGAKSPHVIKSDDYAIYRRDTHGTAYSGKWYFSLYHRSEFIRTAADPDIAKRAAQDHKRISNAGGTGDGTAQKKARPRS